MQSEPVHTEEPALDPADEALIESLPGGAAQIYGGWVWYMDGGSEPFKALTREALIRDVLDAVKRLGVDAALDLPTCGEIAFEAAARSEQAGSLVVVCVKYREKADAIIRSLGHIALDDGLDHAVEQIKGGAVRVSAWRKGGSPEVVVWSVEVVCPEVCA